MEQERDSGLMSAPESELLHEVVKLREENRRLRAALSVALNKAVAVASERHLVRGEN